MVFKKNRIHTYYIDSTTLFLLTFIISLTLVNSWVDKIERHFYGVNEGVMIEEIEVGGCLPGEVRDIVEELAVKYQKIPAEPFIERDTGKIIPEKPGQIVDVEKNIIRIMAASEGEKLKLSTIIIQPRYSASSLEKLQAEVGYYATGISGSYQRYSNISLASKSLNNIVLWPGEVFSYNDTVGPRTPERGYLPAPVFLAGGTSIGYGGGVCQVSSTLYNAVLDADLDIIERHPHSKPVHYVADGKDAAVNYGSLDFKFKNNRDYPLIIKAGIGRGQVWVKILGEG